MEGIFAIAAIIIFIVRLVKASEKKQQTKNNQPPQNEPKFNADEYFEQFEEIFTSLKNGEDKGFEGVNRPNTEGYNQPRLQREEVFHSPKFNENFVETEGTESFEGKCVEEAPNHCAVEHLEDSIYATEITDEVAFSRDDIIKGVIMAEILSKPKCME